MYAPIELSWNLKMCKKFVNTFRNSAKKKAALSQVNSARKQLMQLARKMKKNILSYALKAAQNAEKPEDRVLKKTLTWHKSMNETGEI